MHLYLFSFNAGITEMHNSASYLCECARDLSSGSCLKRGVTPTFTVSHFFILQILSKHMNTLPTVLRAVGMVVNI